MNKRPQALVVVILAWFGLQLASWGFNNWLDSNVSADNLSQAIARLSSALDYLTSGFASGFVLGAAVFSIWDWPVVGKWIRRQRERFRNKEDDEALAKECEELSRYLYEQAALLERVRSENHAHSASSEDVRKTWAEARVADSREEERVRREIGHRVQNAIVQLNARGIKMDLWGFSLSHYELASASYFLAEISDALKEGTYLEREFKAGRMGRNMPARM